MPTKALALSLALGILLAPAIATAQTADELPLDPYVDIRYRLEVVEQDDLPEDAYASTVLIKVGLVTDEFLGFSAQIEGEATIRVGPEDFNDTINGRTQFPVVADPSDVLLNQALIKWNPDTSVSALFGRQAVNLDNQRWFGSVAWRQNDQTLDLARLSAKPIEGLSLDYLYAWRVNRIFGPGSPQGIWRDNDIHGIRAAYDIGSVGTISAFGYFLDIPDAPASSSQTLGVRFKGSQPINEAIDLLFTAEYANQRDHGVNPDEFDLDYWALEQGISVDGFTAKVGVERLEGNGASAVQTPLATLHLFNGWTDTFLVTPGDGLRDLYGDVSYRFGPGSALEGLLLRGVWHDFYATQGGRPYGQEWNFLAVYPLRENVTLLAKFAHYDAQGFAVDTTNGWFQIEVSF